MGAMAAAAIASSTIRCDFFRLCRLNSSEPVFTNVPRSDSLSVQAETKRRRIEE